MEVHGGLRGLREVCVYAWLLCLVVVVGHLFSLIKLGPGGPHPPSPLPPPFDVHVSKAGSGPQPGPRGFACVRGNVRLGFPKSGQEVKGKNPRGGKTPLGTAPRCMGTRVDLRVQ